MRLTFIFVFFLTTLFSQTKIDFRDGKSITLNGKSAGTFVEHDFFYPTMVSRNHQNYFKIDGDTLEIAIYSAWVNDRMDELNIYRIHKNQVNPEYTDIIEDTDDNEKVLSYRLHFSPLNEQKFRYKKYTIYSSIGVTTTFNNFSVESNQREGLEEILKIVKD